MTKIWIRIWRPPESSVHDGCRRRHLAAQLPDSCRRRPRSSTASHGQVLVSSAVIRRAAADVALRARSCNGWLRSARLAKDRGRAGSVGRGTANKTRHWLSLARASARRSSWHRRKLQQVLLLMDEIKGTRGGGARGLAFTGTLGVLDAARKQDCCRPPWRLRETSFYVTPALLRRLLDRDAARLQKGKD